MCIFIHYPYFYDIGTRHKAIGQSQITRTPLLADEKVNFLFKR